METIYLYRPGEKIIKEGESGKGFFILKAGCVEVTKEGLLIAEITGPNTIFGELGDILKEPRTCTVTAKTDTHIIHIPKNVDGVILQYPSIARKLIVMLAKRQKSTTQEMLVWERNHPQTGQSAPTDGEEVFKPEKVDHETLSIISKF